VLNYQQFSWIDEHIRGIASELGNEPEVSRHLNELRASIARLKYARDKHSPEDEQKAIEAARTANSALKSVVAGKERESLL
jgi:hypothetical protein